MNLTSSKKTIDFIERFKTCLPKTKYNYIVYYDEEIVYTDKDNDLPYTKIKTIVIYINKQSGNKNVQVFYSVVKDVNNREILDAESNYWKFNLEKLGGHKVLFINSYLAR